MHISNKNICARFHGFTNSGLTGVHFNSMLKILFSKISNMRRTSIKSIQMKIIKSQKLDWSVSKWNEHNLSCQVYLPNAGLSYSLLSPLSHSHTHKHTHSDRLECMQIFNNQNLIETMIFLIQDPTGSTFTFIHAQIPNTKYQMVFYLNHLKCLTIKHFWIWNWCIW